MATDLKLFGELDFGVIAGTQQRAHLFQIAFVQRLGPAANSWLCSIKILEEKQGAAACLQTAVME
jgi:hypothetical protein